MSAAAETIRVMGLHALEYCERLFDLEEVKEIRIADERVYAGRPLPHRMRLRQRHRYASAPRRR